MHFTHLEVRVKIWIRIILLFNKLMSYFFVYAGYKKKLIGWPDLFPVIFYFYATFCFIVNCLEETNLLPISQEYSWKMTPVWLFHKQLSQNKKTDFCGIGTLINENGNHTQKKIQNPCYQIRYCTKVISTGALLVSFCLQQHALLSQSMR